jgi:hypothetical protein
MRLHAPHSPPESECTNHQPARRAELRQIVALAIAKLGVDLGPYGFWIRCWKGGGVDFVPCGRQDVEKTERTDAPKI